MNRITLCIGLVTFLAGCGGRQQDSSLVTDAGTVVPAAALYEHGNQTGRTKALAAGILTTLGDFNDMASGVRLSKGAYVVLWEHAGGQGASRLFRATSADQFISFGTDPAWNDRVSSGMLLTAEKITGQVAVTRPGVTIYRDINFAGRSLQLGAGVHNLANVFNDAVTSMRVGPNMRVTMAQHADGSGQRDEFKTGQYGLEIVFVGLRFNDQLSHLKIEQL